MISEQYVGVIMLCLICLLPFVFFYTDKYFHRLSIFPPTHLPVVEGAILFDDFIYSTLYHHLCFVSNDE